MQTQSYFSPTQLSHRWAFHVESVRRMVREHRLPAVRIGRRLRIPIEAVEKFEASSSVGGLPVEEGRAA